MLNKGISNHKIKLVVIFSLVILVTIFNLDEILNDLKDNESLPQGLTAWCCLVTPLRAAFVNLSSKLCVSDLQSVTAYMNDSVPKSRCQIK